MRGFRSVILILVIFTILGECRGASDFLNYQYNFFLANRLYKEGQYKEAIGEYTKIINNGFESGNIYYNIGNSYFKLGKLGKAILNYERARRLIPRDGDLEANYRYALSLVKSNVASPRVNILLRLLYRFRDSFTIDELTIILFVLYILLIVTAGLWVFFRRKKTYFITASCALVLMFGVVLFCLIQRISLLKREAVVVSEFADAKYEPFDKGTNYFVLYEGMKVIILRCEDNWCKVRRSDGRSGWVKKKSLEKI